VERVRVSWGIEKILLLFDVTKELLQWGTGGSGDGVRLSWRPVGEKYFPNCAMFHAERFGREGGRGVGLWTESIVRLRIDGSERTRNA